MKKDWRFLKVLYEEKRTSQKAAEKLFVSQPALSYRLKQLEEEFDMKLFFKKENEELNLHQRANTWLNTQMTCSNSCSKRKMACSICKKKVKGTIRLGVSSNFAQYKLPEILKRIF
ncbi:hypothetical protein BsIDN1_49770 [Bacillus safensis]|uniref:HTH lysR-type domain-containing protein n=1 Tax=Bacillus safensis TaxID=561879 RepID=A0A5S9MHT5_BACIA|nr:hypothetical protein BsIDN1_49770 [Bacillus safensis]